MPERAIGDEALRAAQVRRRQLAVALALLVVVCTIVLWCLRGDGPRAPADGSRDALGDGASTAAALADAARSNQRTDAAFVAPAGAAAAMLTGTLSRADGTPVERATLSLVDDFTRESMAEAARGRFAFESLGPGSYRLTVSLDGEVVLQRALTVAAPKTHVDLRLDATWRLTVKALTPDGSALLSSLAEARPGSFLPWCLRAAAFDGPLACDLPPSSLRNVRAGLGEHHEPTQEEKTRTGVVGRLMLPPDGPLTVALLLRSAVLAQTSVEPGRREVTFTLRPQDVQARLATVRMRLVDERDAPLPEVRVDLDPGSSLNAVAVSAADGRVVLSSMLPGCFDLTARHGVLEAPALRVVCAGTDRDFGDVVLRPTVEVPIAPQHFEGSCTVLVRCIDAPPQGCAWSESIRFVSPGQTHALHLLPGRHAICGYASTQWAIAVVDTNALPPLPLQLEFRDIVPLRIESAHRDGYRQLEIRTPLGVPVHRCEFAGARTFWVRMPEGHYEATWLDAAGQRTARTFTLAPTGGVLAIP